ncbi:MAG TPA: chloride channel protein [Verrucomicrobiae bacterium]|jgi:H+/Cl- antiporter ClcA/predicted transcriptional regulator|nr:chloride channel protein [Verrucomicrobiae bacterium]
MLIDFVTNLSFFGRASFHPASPADHHLGLLVIIVPVIGGFIVGLMARYGSSAIRGHGIPEAMEQVLFNESRISPRVAIFKPLSAAVSIGTGGPFGAEGPIIATGGALGSIVGQFMKITAAERKTLLAAGAAAGMTAVFGTPVAAVLLAIELLLFEYRASSIIPVSLATVAAMAVRIFFGGTAAFTTIVVPMTQPTEAALALYVGMGVIFGIISVLLVRLLYLIEDGFEKIHLHWMWWPMIGGLGVGIVGFFDPRTLGIGYENINHIVNGDFGLYALLTLGVLKLISWEVSIGSGTSGGTLAPLFTIGGALGGALGGVAAHLWPQAGIDPRLAALIGMAAVFTGASHAFLASVVFAFEISRQPLGLLPLLGCCSAAYLISSICMKTTIMTEKIYRRGRKVPNEYVPDYLSHVPVKEICSRHLVALQADDSAQKAREWVVSGISGSTHQGFPVLEKDGSLIGVITLKDLMPGQLPPQTTVRELVKRTPLVIYDDSSVREAVDIMAQEQIGRLPVVSRKDPRKILAMLTRSDVLSVGRRRLEETGRRKTIYSVKPLLLKVLYQRKAG